MVRGSRAPSFSPSPLPSFPSSSSPLPPCRASCPPEPATHASCCRRRLLDRPAPRSAVQTLTLPPPTARRPAPPLRIGTRRLSTPVQAPAAAAPDQAQRQHGHAHAPPASPHPPTRVHAPHFETGAWRPLDASNDSQPAPRRIGESVQCGSAPLPVCLTVCLSAPRLGSRIPGAREGTPPFCHRVAGLRGRRS
jgi:hypothetical protein